MPARPLQERLRAFVLQSWPGRLLCGALGFAFLDKVLGVPMPCGIEVAYTLILVLLGCWYTFRLGRYLVKRLLWRIRTKMIVSYLFIAVVPVVLLSIFFVMAGFLGLSLVASYMVSSHLERVAEELRTIAQTGLAGLKLDDPRLPQVLADRLATARAQHPNLSYAVLRDGKALAVQGAAPQALPAWLTAPSFTGLAKDGGEDGPADTVRAVWTSAGASLVVEVPVDEALFADLHKRTGISVVSLGGVVEQEKTSKGVNIRVRGKEKPMAGLQNDGSGYGSAALVSFTRWDTGKDDLHPLIVRFEPSLLLRRLSPGSWNLGDVFVAALAVVGVLFVVLYFLPLGLGLLLARSITKGIHELSTGTERLRGGDFSHPIKVHSRDQLGELAESFNSMAQSVSELLREQAEKERMEEELRIARQIQMSLLPQSTTSLPGLRVAALCLPAAEVGGDYYDLLPLGDTRLGVLVADVSGKGTSAALYMAELKGLVLSLSRIYEAPGRLLSEANRILAANMDSRSFITMTYAVVDTAAGVMRYARAGHNPMIHLEHATGRTRVLTPQGLGLGIDRGDRFDEVLEEAEVPLRSGDVFLFFTDGLSEAMNEKAELFGERRLRDLLEQATSGGPDDTGALKDQILAAIRQFVGGAAQHDDMTLVLLKVV
jgi:phosphoserine phosphatase RsbU/P